MGARGTRSCRENQGKRNTAAVHAGRPSRRRGACPTLALNSRRGVWGRMTHSLQTGCHVQPWLVTITTPGSPKAVNFHLAACLLSGRGMTLDFDCNVCKAGGWRRPLTTDIMPSSVSTRFAFTPTTGQSLVAIVLFPQTTFLVLLPAPARTRLIPPILGSSLADIPTASDTCPNGCAARVKRDSPINTQPRDRFNLRAASLLFRQRRPGEGGGAFNVVRHGQG
jgi:hypothetical protein